MDDKIAIVTGATSGIGKEIARGLARAGFRVGIVCRNAAKGEATVAELERGVPGAVVETFLADLSVQADVRAAAGRIGEHYGRLDVLVNNAGVHEMRAAVSADGLDRMVATNHLGPFLLTNLLLDPLEKSAPARVVVVASEAHRNAGRVDAERFAEPGDYGPPGSFRVYGRTKLLNILFTQELAERLSGTGATANAMCPGLVATGLVRDVPGSGPLGRLVSRTPLLRRPEQGARMAVRLAVDPAFEGRTGGFHSSTPGARFLPENAARRDRDLQRAVWERSAELVGLNAR